MIYNYGLVLTVYMLECDKNVKRHIVAFLSNVSKMDKPAQFHAVWNILCAYEEHKQ